jgi:REP element-mobilizing transposase RayT
MTEHHRRSIRLTGFDYAAAGAYFVTICSYRRDPLFEDPVLSDIVDAQWQDLPRRFSNLRLDAFVVMPNHVHGVVWLVGAPLAGALVGLSTDPRTVGAGASPAPTLGTIIGAYKSLVAVSWLKWIKANAPDRSGKVWQRNYYERIVRNEAELNRIREYIAMNPETWALDRENPGFMPNLEYERAWSWLERSD